jgi:hypothetical protein
MILMLGNWEAEAKPNIINLRILIHDSRNGIGPAKHRGSLGHGHHHGKKSTSHNYDNFINYSVEPQLSSLAKPYGASI